MKRAYYINHWVLTLLIGPFILTFLDFLSAPIQDLTISLRDIYAVTLVLSALLSIPTLATSYFIFRILDKRQIKPAFAKFILILWAIIGLTTTMILIGGAATNEIIFSYSISIIVVGLLLKIKVSTRGNRHTVIS